MAVRANAVFFKRTPAAADAAKVVPLGCLYLAQNSRKPSAKKRALRQLFGLVDVLIDLSQRANSRSQCL
jgi:hypothetical protein